MAHPSGHAAAAVDPQDPEGPRRYGARTVTRFLRFCVVGVLASVVWIGVYLPLRAVWPAPVANLVGLLVSVLFNTEANRYWTFERARIRRVGLHLRAGVLFGVYYLLTTGAVLGLRAAHPDADRLTEAAVLLAVDGLLAVLRFIGMDRWAFRREGATRPSRGRGGRTARRRGRAGSGF